MSQVRAKSESRSGQERAAKTALMTIVKWYTENVYGVHEGPDTVPFFCDVRRVGPMALTFERVAKGDDTALFQLFVLLSMFQGVRDVVVMSRLRSLSRVQAQMLVSQAQLRRSIRASPCSLIRSPTEFVTACDVKKTDGLVECGQHPGVTCVVKCATQAMGRMSDMGKLPVSAWHLIERSRGMASLLQEVVEGVPRDHRAELLIERFTSVHRVGRKLASMFISAVSTPALAPGCSPWFPAIDGNDIVVIDTNVARLVDSLRPPGSARTYSARAEWVREQAAAIDLRHFSSNLPKYSPRMLQQAMYWFGSRSNRAALNDECAQRVDACQLCVPDLCPWRPLS